MTMAEVVTAFERELQEMIRQGREQGIRQGQQGIGSREEHRSCNKWPRGSSGSRRPECCLAFSISCLIASPWTG